MKKSLLTSKLNPVAPLFKGGVCRFLEGGNSLCDSRRDGSKVLFGLLVISDHSVLGKEFYLLIDAPKSSR